MKRRDFLKSAAGVAGQNERFVMSTETWAERELRLEKRNRKFIAAAGLIWLLAVLWQIPYVMRWV